MIKRLAAHLFGGWSPRKKRLWFCALLLVALGAGIALTTTPPGRARAQTSDDVTSITGTVLDPTERVVCEAEVALFLNGADEPAQVTHTHCEDGTFVIELEPDTRINTLRLEITRPHFEDEEWVASAAQVERINMGRALRVPDIELGREINASFWVASITFGIILALIAFEVMHNTLVSLMGVAIVLVTSAIGRFEPSLFIFDFERALGFVDFEVIFLVMGMMIVIAAIEETGIFQWVTYQSYRLSGGRVWLLVTILMMITAVASALLDNVTTMLLMTPLTIQISIAMGINPLSLLIPEVLASNVGGITTLIGTPTNILIGSYAGLGFNDFLINLTPGVLVAQAALIAYVIIRYRPGWEEATDEGLSESLLNRLEEQGQIQEPVKLRKGGIIFGLMLVGFVLGESIHMAPAVTAIVGAVLMLLFVEPDVETMLQVVDWTTLMFFIALFILVGAIQEVGLLAVISGAIRALVGESVVAAILVLTWSAALLSGVVANIPFTAAMLPVVEFLTANVPGAQGNMLYYSLSVGAAMGGNSSLIGASANMVTAGISERAGYPITYMEFLKAGLPATIITVAIGSLWLLFHFGLLF